MAKGLVCSLPSVNRDQTRKVWINFRTLGNIDACGPLCSVWELRLLMDVACL